MSSIFILGTAGAGKSLMTHVLKDHLVAKEWEVVTVNLDPGAESLPYEPDVDVRNSVNLHELMDKYDLGPNGGLVLAADMIASKSPELLEEISDFSPDYIIFDTPGQMELFAYRPSGPFLVKQLGQGQAALLFLFDSWLMTDAANFLSLMLLASSVKLRFGLPFLPVLSKADLVPDSLKKIEGWAREPESILDELSRKLKGDDYVLYSGLLKTLGSKGFVSRLWPVSSSTGEGLLDLSAAIANIFQGGEDQAG
ncbi:MAG TPA: ATP/GTP-binding protein [Conexivisphaerales archaeon]|nr:ATP/GTP-binding protein [Conexivisphaerales archaeon]